MIPNSAVWIAGANTFPRIGGGDPNIIDQWTSGSDFSPHRRGIPSLNPDFREFVRIAENKKIMYKFYNIPRDKNNIFEGFTSRCLKRNAV